MESQVFSPAAYSVSPVDLIPPDNTDDDADDFDETRALDYATVRRCVDLEDLMELLCCRLRDSVQLQALMQDVLESPPSRERPGLHPMDALRLASDVVQTAMDVADEYVSMRASTQCKRANTCMQTACKPTCGPTLSANGRMAMKSMCSSMVRTKIRQR